MTVPLTLRRLAQAGFDDAVDWYEQRYPSRGVAFASAVRRVFTDIATSPAAYPEVYPDVREALVSGYPYAVYYILGAARVTVIAVFHTSRDPSQWQSRA